MSLFSESYRLELSEDEWAIFTRPLTGAGGAQFLLHRLRRSENGPRCLRLDDQDLDRAYQYAYRYASGGFQDRFRAVVKAGIRAGWVPVGEGTSQGAAAPFGKAR